MRDRNPDSADDENPPLGAWVVVVGGGAVVVVVGGAVVVVGGGAAVVVVALGGLVVVVVSLGGLVVVVVSGAAVVVVSGATVVVVAGATDVVDAGLGAVVVDDVSDVIVSCGCSVVTGAGGGEVGVSVLSWAAAAWRGTVEPERSGSAEAAATTVSETIAASDATSQISGPLIFIGFRETFMWVQTRRCTLVISVKDSRCSSHLASSRAL